MTAEDIENKLKRRIVKVIDRGHKRGGNLMPDAIAVELGVDCTREFFDLCGVALDEGLKRDKREAAAFEELVAFKAKVMAIVAETGEHDPTKIANLMGYASFSEDSRQVCETTFRETDDLIRDNPNVAPAERLEKRLTEFKKELTETELRRLPDCARRTLQNNKLPSS